MATRASGSTGTAALRYLGFPVLVGGLFLLNGCGWVVNLSQSMRLRGYEKEIGNATDAIAKAPNASQRAKEYSRRGSAYTEKARYSRGFKLISAEEYERLFGLAIKDHAQAISLDPDSAEACYNRGKAYWDRGTAEMTEHKDFKASFDRAAADFETSTVKAPQNFMAFDMLGTARLADAYCGRGQFDQTKLNLQAAALDYEKSVELGAKTQDGCSCEPYNSLLAVYTETRQYDKAWNFVHWSQGSKHWLDRELVDRLKKASGRNR